MEKGAARKQKVLHREADATAALTGTGGSAVRKQKVAGSTTVSDSTPNSDLDDQTDQKKRNKGKVSKGLDCTTKRKKMSDPENYMESNRAKADAIKTMKDDMQKLWQTMGAFFGSRSDEQKAVQMFGEDGAEFGAAQSSKATSAEVGAAQSSKAVSAEVGAAQSSKAVSAEVSAAQSSKAASAELGAARSSKAASAEVGAAQSSKAASAEVGAAQSNNATSAEVGAAQSSKAASAELGAAQSSKAASAELGAAQSSKAASSELGAAPVATTTGAELGAAQSSKATSAELAGSMLSAHNYATALLSAKNSPQDQVQDYATVLAAHASTDACANTARDDNPESTEPFGLKTPPTPGRVPLARCSVSPVLPARSRAVPQSPPPTPGSKPLFLASSAAAMPNNSPLPGSIFASLHDGIQWSPSVEARRMELLPPVGSADNSPFKGLSNISLSPDTQRGLDSIVGPAPTFGVPP